ncbi:MAG: hypothetical protein WBA91_07675, partial [Paracoccaceae bacterium]
MHHPSLEAFFTNGRQLLARGPVALIFAEDEVELVSTLEHHRKIGFRQIILFGPERLVAELPDGACTTVNCDTSAADAARHILNRVILVTPPATWLYWGYNAEYLYFPFCESRSVGELLAFHAEERRAAMVTYVIDLYAQDLRAHPNAVSRDNAMFDGQGYFAMPRYRDGQVMERQMDIFGGIRWRYEQHVPWPRQRIDRVALFRPQKDLHLREDGTFSIEEMNTISCPWHHNLTGAVASFRTAKALCSNPGSKWEIGGFQWSGSERFGWSSQQL